MSIKYRSDIDGLRAIAVLAVLFYHTGVSIFSGGYVGVDIFFVISGYLITGIIIRETQDSKFSILKFYERRIRRIYPALYAVLIFILIITHWLYNPHDYKEIGQSVAATVIFISNLLFSKQSGYFNELALANPILHTWSLAVEEQFYLVFPLLVWLITRFAKAWLKFALVFLTLLSFSLSVHYTKLDPSASFYFAHLRAWELLIGGLLALDILPSKISATTRNIYRLIGIVLLIISIFFYTEKTSFPGISALLPTLGAALIIYSGIGADSSGINFLKMPALVFIGKISYSLYLWHWPIIVFWKSYRIDTPTITDKVCWTAVSFAAAILSWKFIENPFRSASFLSRQSIFTLAGSAMGIVLATSAIIFLKGGLPQRFHNNPQLMLNLNVDADWENRPQCETNPNWENGSLMAKINLCPLGNATNPTFIVWGDSHTQAISPAINFSAQRMKQAGYATILYGCMPLIGVDMLGVGGCLEHNNSVLEYIKENPEIKTVFLAGRWAIGTYETYDKGGWVLIDKTKNSAALKGNEDIFKAGLLRTVKRLLDLNRNVVLVEQAPEINFDVPASFFVAVRTGQDINSFAPTYSEYLQDNDSAITFLYSLKDEYQLSLVKLPDQLCAKESCAVIANGHLLYTDNNHLSVFGSEFVAPAFDPIFMNVH